MSNCSPLQTVLLWMIIAEYATLSCLASGSPAAPTITVVTPHESGCTVSWLPVPKAENITLCYYENGSEPKEMKCEHVQASSDMHTITHLRTEILYTVEMHSYSNDGQSTASSEPCLPGGLDHFEVTSLLESCMLLWDVEMFGWVNICTVNQDDGPSCTNTDLGYFEKPPLENGATRVLKTTAYDRRNGTKILQHDFHCAPESKTAKSRRVRYATSPPKTPIVKVVNKTTNCELSWNVDYDVDNTTICHIRGGAVNLRRGQKADDVICNTVLFGHKYTTAELDKGKITTLTVYAINSAGKSDDVVVACKPNGDVVKKILIGVFAAVGVITLGSIFLGALISHGYICKGWSFRKVKKFVDRQNILKGEVTPAGNAV